MPRRLRIAMQHAHGEGGVAVVVLPGNIAHLPATTTSGAGSFVTERAAPPSQVQALAKALKLARKVRRPDSAVPACKTRIPGSWACTRYGAIVATSAWTSPAWA
jgi:hypothetical protein